MRMFLANNLSGIILGAIHIFALMLVAAVIGIVPALVLAVVAGGLSAATLVVNRVVTA